MTELKLTNSSGTSPTRWVLCDNACSNSWLSDSLKARLGLQGTPLKLTVKGVNTEKIIDIKLFQSAVTPHKDPDFEAFTVCSYLRETLNVRFDIILARNLPTSGRPRYSYQDIDMILGRMSTMPSVR